MSKTNERAGASAYEKMGAFYLGRDWTPDSGIGSEPFLYDSKDLTTHGVCVGMTGSGKTGLCVTLLEEAAIDGIPAIAIDPKGDLGNLMLTFPDLKPASFAPWIDPGAAARRGHGVEEEAARVAGLWRRGLGDWGQDGARIARYARSVERRLYTPGGSAGRGLSILGSFAAPRRELLDDAEAYRDRIQGAVGGLLSLLGIDPDPLRSRENILLANLLDYGWREGRDLTPAALVREVQAPPFDRVGVMDLESFYPSAERFELAMMLNNLLASPGFAAWAQGDPLDVGGLLYGPGGRPRLSILSIAHLSDSERMFFLTLLLNEVIGWMRSVPGSSSLKALLYMDEIFGFFPPTAAPPSKRPMLTLLKQARAHGLGVLLATQNPGDLDYKGLANVGTWFVGRLQTERDREKMIEGFRGTGPGTDDPRAVSDRIAGLESRVFLMRNVHEDAPVLFHTRWALSYLAGPLGRDQIRRLNEADREEEGAESRPAADSPTAAGSEARPVLPPKVPECFLPPETTVPPSGERLYAPALLGVARLHYVAARRDLDEWKTIRLLADVPEGERAVDWDGAEPLDASRAVPEEEGLPGARYAPLPAAAARARQYASWRKAFAGYLYREQTMTLWRSRAPRLVSMPGESEDAFRARLVQAAREKRDLDLEKLRKRYGPKLKRLEDRIARARRKVEREKDQYGQQKLQTAISVGATVLGALFGRKVASAGNIGRGTTAMRGAGRAMREKEDIRRAEKDLERYRQDLLDMEAEFQEAREALPDLPDPAEMDVEPLEIKPRKSDIEVTLFSLAWVPDR